MNFLSSSANNSLVQTWGRRRKRRRRRRRGRRKRRRKERKKKVRPDRRTILSPRGELDFSREARSKATGKRGERRGQNRDYILNRNPPTREYLFRQLWQLKIYTFTLPIRINSSLLFSIVLGYLHAHVPFVLLVQNIIFDVSWTKYFLELIDRF